MLDRGARMMRLQENNDKVQEASLNIPPLTQVAYMLVQLMAHDEPPLEFKVLYRRGVSLNEALLELGG
jgi:hypothetical protein